MTLPFRLKELKLAGVILMLYTFVVIFHLIRDLEDGHMKELREKEKKLKFYIESKRNVQDYSGYERNDDTLRAKDKKRLDAVLREILLNKNPKSEDLQVPKPIIAGVKRPQRNKYDNRFADKEEFVDDDEASMDLLKSPGHMGAPVNIDPQKLSPEDKTLFDKGWADHNFNQFVSDKISIHREVPDRRHPNCSKLNYDWRLPKMSVLICFHNEAWSTLLRTVHSVLNRTPPHLLEEIILVDDFSDMEHLRANLTNYVASLPKVKVIRTKKWEGLVRARLLGTDASKGEVITFLDSHCECLEGWAEPLLARIGEDPSAVVWPLIPSIDKETFELKRGTEVGVTQKGGFYWDMNFRWIPVPKEDNKDKDVTSPVRSPTMAGGLFSINKKFFKYLGTYDPHFELWGSENMELSFKIWMCGGSLEILPCSVVGHVFRDSSPMNFNHTTIVHNSQRVAEIWLDEYKDIYYENIGTKLDNIGDLSSRIELRQELRCRSFDWYIKTIYPEVFLPLKALYRGKLHPVGLAGYCLDAVKKRAYNTPVRLNKCRDSITHFWYITEIGELRSGYECLDVGLDKSYQTVQNGRCHGKGGNQYWEYTQNQTLRKPKQNVCLTVNLSTKDISLQVCNENTSQKWYWEPFKS